MWYWWPHGTDLVPVDGMVATSRAVLDESALTGEAVPVERAAGEPVRSGVVNAGDPFDLAANREGGRQYVCGHRPAGHRGRELPGRRLSGWADRYALWFLPFSLAAAGLAWAVAGPARAVAVLVVATPCPLILAAPVALVSGMSVAARRG